MDANYNCDAYMADDVGWIALICLPDRDQYSSDQKQNNYQHIDLIAIEDEGQIGKEKKS